MSAADGDAVPLPGETARRLREAFGAAMNANQAFQLAQKDWESKFHAWEAAELRARYELGVPPDFVLNLETGAFERPRGEAPATSRR
jgi:hypothetical protein